VSANEQIQNNAAVMIASHRIRIRYRSGMKANFRIAYAGRNLNIVSIVDINMAHQWLDILVKEAV
jgi:SPP1 family predicted phage head-tail adaptor